MGDIGSDTFAQFEMMIEAYQLLQSKSPEHPLLALAKLHDDRLGFDFALKYFDRCVRESDRWKVQGYARYTFALEAAAKGEQIRLLDTNPSCDF